MESSGGELGSRCTCGWCHCRAGRARGALAQRFGLPDVALEDSHPPNSSTSTTAHMGKVVSTRGGGQLNEEVGEDLPDDDGDGRGDGIKRQEWKRSLTME